MLAWSNAGTVERCLFAVNAVRALSECAHVRVLLRGLRVATVFAAESIAKATLKDNGWAKSSDSLTVQHLSTQQWAALVVEAATMSAEEGC